MAVAAGVVGVARKIAAVAFFEMAAEGRRAADLDGAHDAQLFVRKRVSFPVILAMQSENVGHFESGPGHAGYRRGFGCSLPSCGVRPMASSGLGVPAMVSGETLV
jgi:hypothetical protein